MEETAFYEVFKNERMTQGDSLAVSSSVSYENADISVLAGQPAAALQALRDDSADSENIIFRIVQTAVAQWEKQAATTQRLDRALEYVKTPPVQHTANQWQDEPDGIRRISNTVYTMFCKLREDAKWDVWKGSNPLKVKWRAEWGVYLNKPVKKGVGCIAGQERSFDTKAAAEKYLQGRAAAYAELFTDVAPPIPKEHAQHFMINGLLLPGYSIEGQERQREGHAAAERSEGGVSVAADKKPSVLGQLAASKEQIKETPAQSKPQEPER